MIVREIPLSSVVLNPKLYDFSDALYSIDLSPKLQAPLLVGEYHGDLILLDGYQRWKTWSQTDEHTIQGIVIQLDSPADGLLSKLHWEKGLKTYSYMEKGRILFCFQDELGFSEDTIQAQIMPLLNEPPSIQRIQTLYSIHTLNTSLARFCIQHQFSLSWATRLNTWDTESQATLADFVMELGYSAGDLRKLFDWVSDIGLRDGITPHVVLQSESIQNIRANEQWDSVQKRKQIMNILQQQRYPAYHAHLRAWHAQTKKIPKGLRVDPPPYFEGSRLTLHLDIHTLDQLVELMNWMKNPEGKQQLTHLLDFLNHPS
jgi:hypothetical protein